MSDSQDQPGFDTLVGFEQLLDRFEAAWRASQRPNLNEFVSSVPEVSRAPLFWELLSLELGLRH